MKVDAHLQKIAAVNIQAWVCLVIYFSTATGRLLNICFSVYKVVLLGVVSLVGFITLVSGKEEGKGDFMIFHHGKGTPKPGDYAAAFLLVLYSFHGWENASYVSSFRSLQVVRNGG